MLRKKIEKKTWPPGPPYLYCFNNFLFLSLRFNTFNIAVFTIFHYRYIINSSNYKMIIALNVSVEKKIKFQIILRAFPTRAIRLSSLGTGPYLAHFADFNFSLIHRVTIGSYRSTSRISLTIAAIAWLSRMLLLRATDHQL